MSVLDTLPRAAFDKIEFPYTERNAKLVARYHVHEFPRMGGGAVEKNGRKVWTFSFKVPFHETFEEFPDLYPGRLAAFTEKASRLFSAVLVVPGIGEIRAFITELDRTLVAKARSGESVTLNFVEDDLEPFRNATKKAGTDGIKAAAEKLFKAKDEAREVYPYLFQLEEEEQAPRPSLFDALNDAINLVASVRDQAELYGNLFAAKLERVATLCKTIMRTFDFLQNPDSAELGRGLRSVWDATNNLAKDIAQKGPRSLVPFVVPARMTAAGVAAAFYGDGSRGGEILAANNISDPFAIPAGTVLQVYQDARDGG